MIPVFYRPEQVTLIDSYSPSPGKPKLVVDDWSRKFDAINIIEFDPVSKSELYLAHAPSYVDGVLSLRKDNGFGNRSSALRDTLPFTTGSIVAAAKYSMVHGGVSVSPTSGFHHAGYCSGGGFCTFNGLMVAAMSLIEDGASMVGIIDCDMHYGDGTQNIIDTIKARNVLHWSAGKYFGMPDEEEHFLKRLQVVSSMMADVCDVVLYQAGADPHLDDPLGGWMSTEGMRKRDRIVFDTCKSKKAPLVWNLAGGYQTPVDKVVKLHTNTMEECIRSFQ